MDTPMLSENAVTFSSRALHNQQYKGGPEDEATPAPHKTDLHFEVRQVLGLCHYHLTPES
jgi:hypothetical protein